MLSPPTPLPVVQVGSAYRILLGLVDSKPGSSPLNPSWVEFSSSREAKEFLDKQNKVFRKSASAKQPLKAVQSKPGMALTSLRHPKGGDIFEVIEKYNGNYKAYKRGKAQEIGEAERARRERAEAAGAAEAPVPRVKQARPPIEAALETNVLYRIYSAANKIMRLGDLGKEFEANNPDITIPIYGSKEAFVEAMFAAYPLPVKPSTKTKVQQEDRQAKKMAENENGTGHGRGQRRNQPSWNNPKRFSSNQNDKRYR